MKYWWEHRENNKWRLDQDYIWKLSATDAQWLHQFNREWVGGMFKNGPVEHYKYRQSKRKIWRDNYKASCDIMSYDKRRVERENPESLVKPGHGLTSESETMGLVLTKDLLKDKKLRHKIIRSLRNEK